MLFTQVFFKRMIGEGKLGQVSLFLSLLGLTNALFLWVVFLILYFVGLEKMVADEIPWGYLCGSSSLSLGEFFCSKQSCLKLNFYE